MTMAEADLAVAETKFVRTAAIEAQPPPVRVSGPLAWMRDNLLSTPFNIALTLVILLLLGWAAWELAHFLVIDAVWSGKDREACLISEQQREVGDADDVNAGRVLRLREIHRAELAGADEADAQGVAVGRAALEHLVEVHGGNVG